MKTIGILGGMGPAATVDLFERIVRSTPARSDQAHLPIVIINDPRVPDRSEAMLHGGPDPVPMMVDGLEKLSSVGADFVVIPCNTAHYFLDRLRQASTLPIIDMIEETARAVSSQHPRSKRVGLLATDGTIRAGLYQRALEQVGLIPVLPDGQATKQTMAGIYGACGVKSVGASIEAKRLFTAAGHNLIDQGAEVVILGCTEIPLALHEGDLPLPLVASNQILAEVAVREASYSVSSLPSSVGRVVGEG